MNLKPAMGEPEMSAGVRPDPVVVRAPVALQLVHRGERIADLRQRLGFEIEYSGDSAHA